MEIKHEEIEFKEKEIDPKKQKERETLAWRIAIVTLVVLVVATGIYFINKGFNALFRRSTQASTPTISQMLSSTSEPPLYSTPAPVTGYNYVPVAVPPPATVSPAPVPQPGYGGLDYSNARCYDYLGDTQYCVHPLGSGDTSQTQFVQPVYVQPQVSGVVIRKTPVRVYQRYYTPTYVAPAPAYVPSYVPQYSSPYYPSIGDPPPGSCHDYLGDTQYCVHPIGYLGY